MRNELAPAVKEVAEERRVGNGPSEGSNLNVDFGLTKAELGRIRAGSERVVCEGGAEGNMG